KPLPPEEAAPQAQPLGQLPRNVPLPDAARKPAAPGPQAMMTPTALGAIPGLRDRPAADAVASNEAPAIGGIAGLIASAAVGAVRPSGPKLDIAQPSADEVGHASLPPLPPDAGDHPRVEKLGFKP